MKKLIQELDGLRKSYLVAGVNHLNDEEYAYNQAISDVIDIIKQHDPWIIVEDRLPEEGVMVLCFNAEYVRPYFVASWCPEEGWFIDVDGYVYVITHWMPLPEPPKQ